MHQENGDQTVQRRVSVKMETVIQSLDTASVMQVGNSLYSRVAFTETPKFERQRQRYDVTSDITLIMIKLLGFLNKSKQGTPKMGAIPDNQIRWKR